jgi:hypothetical protein
MATDQSSPARVTPILYFIFKGRMVDPRMRASNEHILSCAFREQEDGQAALPVPPYHSEYGTVQKH